MSIPTPSSNKAGSTQAPSILSDKPPLPPIPVSAPPQAILPATAGPAASATTGSSGSSLGGAVSSIAKDAENKENRDDSNFGSGNGGSGIGSKPPTAVVGRPKDEARRSCNRCQNCPGFSSHEWRNTCTTCRCPRSCHDISIGARCCGFHRAGFDATTSASTAGAAAAATAAAAAAAAAAATAAASSSVGGGGGGLSSNVASPCSTTSSSSGSQLPPPPPPPPLLPQSGGSGGQQQLPLTNASTPSSTTSSAQCQSQTCSRNASAEAAGFAWIPTGLQFSKLDDWMRQFPQHKVPKLGSEGETYRQHQLAHQLPKQDLSLKYCQHVSPRDKSSFQDFICARNDIALDIGHVITVQAASSSAIAAPSILTGGGGAGKKEEASAMTTNQRQNLQASTGGGGGVCCVKCQKEFHSGDLAVVAPRFGLRALWHPACFTCTTCNEPLVDLTYCIHNDALYCARHYAENLKPRCGACDELIFAGQYTKALGKEFHPEHFVCVSCNESLTGGRYVLTDERPCCLPCYEQNFTHSCRSCGNQIGLESKDMSYKDMHWHEACFACKKCNASLVDKPFAAKNTLIFCASCYDAEFASRCDACGDTFRPGMKKMEYKSKKWHDKCFQCVVCKHQVGSRPFIIPNETDVYCVGCFEEKFATKCTKCKKVMTTGGVTFKNEAWHRECFVCANCHAMLAGQKFASREDKPYCASCFGELFAKRCTACTKPITGAGGTRFISFEGRHWHSQCFVCAVCKVSMAGKGFITDGEDIICPDCAKNKLMGGGGGGGSGGAAAAGDKATPQS